MRVISITGGIGAGKSEVLRVLRESFGAQIILADEVAHQLMEPEREGYQRVVAALGSSFLNPDGSIHRKKLAELIFQDETALAKMNAIIHPMVWQEIQAQLTRSDKALAAVEAALLDPDQTIKFDEIWYVFTSKENRIRRLMAGRGYSEEKCLDIMKNQAAEEEYRSLATAVLDNNGSTEEMQAQIAALLQKGAKPCGC